MANKNRHKRTQGKPRRGIAERVKGWEASGLTQREYCELHQIPLSTFGYHRRREIQGAQEEAGAEDWAPSMLLPVSIQAQAAVSEQGSRDFVLTLRNGRRIEAGWGFVETELARLVRVAERD